MAGTKVRFENTNFIFRTNFSGDPSRDTYGSTARKANIKVSEELKPQLEAMGLNVKTTKPKPGFEDDFEPTHFIAIRVNYNSYSAPEIYLVTPGAPPVLLDEESVGVLDTVYVTNVNCECNVYHNEARGTTSLYVNVLYVEHEPQDPFAAQYAVSDEPF